MNRTELQKQWRAVYKILQEKGISEEYSYMYILSLFASHDKVGELIGHTRVTISKKIKENVTAMFDLANCWSLHSHLIDLIKKQEENNLAGLKVPEYIEVSICILLLDFKNDENAVTTGLNEIKNLCNQLHAADTQSLFIKFVSLIGELEYL